MKNNLKIVLTTALIGAALGAQAQTSPIRPAYTYPATPTQPGPAAVQVGDSPVFMTPYIGFGVGRDDNLFLAHTNQRSSTLYITSPGVKLDARSPSTVMQLSYQAQIGRYTQSRDDDYVDQVARLQSDTAFSGRSFLRLGVDYLRSHDPRGSTDRAISNQPDRYQLVSPNATFALGAPGAQGRVEVYWSDAYKKYINNRSTTILSDRDIREVGGAFYWRVMPKTYLLAEARHTDIDYRSSLSPLSSVERRYFGGVTWEATALTTGTLKVGRLEKKFDTGLLPDFSGTSWEGTINWAPRTYSTFDFYGARTTNESTGLGSFLLSDIYGLTWNHAWSSVLNTAVLLRYQRDEYQNVNRTDDTKSLGFKVGYRFRRWLTIGAEYTYTQRDSNITNFEYDKNLYLLTATASM